MPKSVVLGFDLDGTLVDSVVDIRNSIREVCIVNKVDPAIAEKVQLGPPFHQMVAAVSELPPATLDQMYQDFRRIYDHCGFKETRLYPNAIQTLQWAKDQGVSLFLVTNKPRSGTEMMLDQFDLRTFFGSNYYCPDPTQGEKHRNKVSMIRDALAKFANPVEGVYVGDTTGDIDSGREAGLKTIAVSFGYQSVSSLKKSHPDLIIDDLSQIMTDFSKLVPTLFRARNQ